MGWGRTITTLVNPTSSQQKPQPYPKNWLRSDIKSNSDHAWPCQPYTNPAKTLWHRLHGIPSVYLKVFPGLHTVLVGFLSGHFSVKKTSITRTPHKPPYYYFPEERFDQRLTRVTGCHDLQPCSFPPHRPRRTNWASKHRPKFSGESPSTPESTSHYKSS